VRRALDNLVSNAMKYSEKETAISLSAHLKQAHYCYVVENEGTEFSEQERSKLFSPFFRGDKGRNTEGLGLGLTVVEKVAQLHGGKIVYAYQQGRHCFTLMLPLM
jgi:signal transduction histidine kinase